MGHQAEDPCPIPDAPEKEELFSEERNTNKQTNKENLTDEIEKAKNK